MSGIDQFISESDFLKNLANMVGMKKTVYEPAELPLSREEFARQTLQKDPLYYLPKSTIPADLPKSVAAYRADPTGKYGGKDGLETQPISRLTKGGDRYHNPNPDPKTSNTFTDSSKAVQELYRYARLNGAAAKLGYAAMSPEEIASFALKEGRTDLGYNALMGGKKDIDYEKSLRAKYDITDTDANFLAAVAAKRRVADKLGISLAEAWNGTGRNALGTSGADYARDLENHKKAAMNEKNKALLDIINRGIADGQKHGFPALGDNEKNTRSKRKEVPYKRGGDIAKPIAGGHKTI
jgi:hypothetical protein